MKEIAAFISSHCRQADYVIGLPHRASALLQALSRDKEHMQLMQDVVSKLRHPNAINYLSREDPHSRMIVVFDELSEHARAFFSFFRSCAMESPQSWKYHPITLLRMRSGEAAENIEKASSECPQFGEFISHLIAMKETQDRLDYVARTMQYTQYIEDMFPNAYKNTTDTTTFRLCYSPKTARLAFAQMANVMANHATVIQYDRTSFAVLFPPFFDLPASEKAITKPMLKASEAHWKFKAYLHEDSGCIDICLMCFVPTEVTDTLILSSVSPGAGLQLLAELFLAFQKHHGNPIAIGRDLADLCGMFLEIDLFRCIRKLLEENSLRPDSIEPDKQGFVYYYGEEMGSSVLKLLDNWQDSEPAFFVDPKPIPKDLEVPSMDLMLFPLIREVCYDEYLRANRGKQIVSRTLYERAGLSFSKLQRLLGIDGVQLSMALDLVVGPLGVTAFYDEKEGVFDRYYAATEIEILHELCFCVLEQIQETLGKAVSDDVMNKMLVALWHVGCVRDLLKVGREEMQPVYNHFGKTVKLRVDADATTLKSFLATADCKSYVKVEEKEQGRSYWLVEKPIYQYLHKNDLNSLRDVTRRLLDLFVYGSQNEKDASVGDEERGEWKETDSKFHHEEFYLLPNFFGETLSEFGFVGIANSVNKYLKAGSGIEPDIEDIWIGLKKMGTIKRITMRGKVLEEKLVSTTLFDSYGLMGRLAFLESTSLIYQLYSALLEVCTFFSGRGSLDININEAVLALSPKGVEHPVGRKELTEELRRRCLSWNAPFWKPWCISEGTIESAASDVASPSASGWHVCVELDGISNIDGHPRPVRDLIQNLVHIYLRHCVLIGIAAGGSLPVGDSFNYSIDYTRKFSAPRDHALLKFDHLEDARLFAAIATQFAEEVIHAVSMDTQIGHHALIEFGFVHGVDGVGPLFKIGPARLGGRGRCALLNAEARGKIPSDISPGDLTLVNTRAVVCEFIDRLRLISRGSNWFTLRDRVRKIFMAEDLLDECILGNKLCKTNPLYGVAWKEHFPRPLDRSAALPIYNLMINLMRSNERFSFCEQTADELSERLWVNYRNEMRRFKQVRLEIILDTIDRTAHFTHSIAGSPPAE